MAQRAALHPTPPSPRRAALPQDPFRGGRGPVPTSLREPDRRLLWVPRPDAGRRLLNRCRHPDPLPGPDHPPAHPDPPPHETDDVLRGHKGRVLRHVRTLAAAAAPVTTHLVGAWGGGGGSGGMVQVGVRATAARDWLGSRATAASSPGHKQQHRPWGSPPRRPQQIFPAARRLADRDPPSRRSEDRGSRGVSVGWRVGVRGALGTPPGTVRHTIHESEPRPSDQVLTSLGTQPLGRVRRVGTVPHLWGPEPPPKGV